MESLSMVPSRLTGRQFEEEGLRAWEFYERAGVASVGRYGVSAVRTKGEWIVMPSLPDFEGVTAGGRHIITDFKVCSAASFSWEKYRIGDRSRNSNNRGARFRQLAHMRRRCEFGALCWFTIHWCRRTLKTKVVDAETWMLPVLPGDSYWDMVQSGVVKSLTLGDCQDRGIRIPWSTPGRLRRPIPMVLDAAQSFL